MERQLRSLKIPYEEWEVLFRQLTLIKLRLLEENAPPDIATWQGRLSPGKVTDWLPLLRAGAMFLARVHADEEEGRGRVPIGVDRPGIRTA